MAEDALAPRRSFKRHFHNWISWAGILLTASALFAFLLLLAIDLSAAHPNPYVGILAYLIAALFFLAGLVIALVGALLYRRRERRGAKVAEPLVVSIDFSRARD